MDLRDPEPVVPTQASLFTELRGRRAMVGVPGVGFRGGLRADNPVVQAGRTFVPVLIEQDFYRAEIEHIEVFAPLVPVDRVWIENVGPPPLGGPSVLDAPPVRYAVPASEVAYMTGERIVQRVADGFVRDLRAISEKYTNGSGSLSVRLCSESDWYSWAINGRVPPWSEVPVEILWLE